MTKEKGLIKACCLKLDDIAGWRPQKLAQFSQNEKGGPNN
jgi:hypothetical protein